MDQVLMSRTFALAYYPAYDEMPDLGPLNIYMRWWADLRDRVTRPSRDNLEFRDLRGWHSRVTLCRVLDDRSDMVARIVGEEVKDLFHSYFEPQALRFDKGVQMRDIVRVTESEQKAHLENIVDGESIALSRGRLTLTSGRKVDVFSLDFPLLGGTDGKSYVLTIYDFELAPEERGDVHQAVYPM